MRGMSANPGGFLNATEVYEVEFKESVEATALLNRRKPGVAADR